MIYTMRTEGIELKLSTHLSSARGVAEGVPPAAENRRLSKRLPAPGQRRRAIAASWLVAAAPAIPENPLTERGIIPLIARNTDVRAPVLREEYSVCGGSRCVWSRTCF